MQSGRLRQRITIERQEVVRDEYGAELITWAPLPIIPTVWASILPGSSGERFLTGAAQEQATISHTVRLRYREDITPKMRIVWGQRHLYVQTITDPDGRTRETLLLCEEVQDG